jgi:hypothetical protein
MLLLDGGDASVAGGIFLEEPNPNAFSLSATLGEVLRMAEAMSDCWRERVCDWERDSGRVREELTEEADEDGLTLAGVVEVELAKGIWDRLSGTSVKARESNGACVSMAGSVRSWD